MHDLFGILKKKKYKYALYTVGMVLHYIIQIQHDRSTLNYISSTTTTGDPSPVELDATDCLTGLVLTKNVTIHFYKVKTGFLEVVNQKDEWQELPDRTTLYHTDLDFLNFTKTA